MSLTPEPECWYENFVNVAAVSSCNWFHQKPCHYALEADMNTKGINGKFKIMEVFTERVKTNSIRINIHDSAVIYTLLGEVKTKNDHETFDSHL